MLDFFEGLVENVFKTNKNNNGTGGNQAWELIERPKNWYIWFNIANRLGIHYISTNIF